MRKVAWFLCLSCQLTLTMRTVSSFSHLLNPNWSIQIFRAPAVCKGVLIVSYCSNNVPSRIWYILVIACYLFSSSPVTPPPPHSWPPTPHLRNGPAGFKTSCTLPLVEILNVEIGRICGGREGDSEKTAHVGRITKIVDYIRIVFGLPYNYKPNLSLKVI